ncbi:cytochrome P450 [Halioglobus maricola]|uniref:Cytochrome P450 n=1 Tax=Halioglobus maricola TaxID=2601894 RepID=A0A5P9NF42_9GAMM|nr:cytochrome P450 [Halioglobus maricola]QFU74372.1 cytochrome P450 [Halioglobus maricola]
MSTCPYTNLLDPDLYGQGNHLPKLGELRALADAPIIKIEDPLQGVPYWAVLERQHVDYIAKHPAIFSSEKRLTIPTEYDDETIAMQTQMLVNMDPPKHGKFRRIARNAFTPKAVESYHATFKRYAKEIVDSVAAKGQCEFITEVAAELPLMAILALCGVPIEDRDKFFTWTNQMMFQEDEDIGGDDPAALAQDAAANIYLYAGELAKKHAESPLTNIVGSLLDSEVEDEKLTEEEFQLFFLMLIAAGNESTRSVTAHGMRLLMENPDQLQMLVDDPSLIPDACEEMLRYNPAFVTMRRTVMEDTEVAGVEMKEGDKVLLHWHLINQDPGIFEEPEKFDITRARRMPELAREHRSFGIGTHFCLGAHLARMEMQIMFEEVIPRLKNPQFAEPVKYMRDYFVNGIKEMNITFDPEPKP